MSSDKLVCLLLYVLKGSVICTGAGFLLHALFRVSAGNHDVAALSHCASEKSYFLLTSTLLPVLLEGCTSDN